MAPLAELRTVWRRRTLPGDLAAGAVLGIESVPDALARGVLAGVNPLAGLNAYLFGMLGGALFTATPLMAVQSTGALAVIVADVGLNENPDPARALFTLSMLTGIAMLAAGVLRLGKLLRFVSTAVLTGFLAALGINIVLSQLATLTGYQSVGGGTTIARFIRMMTDLDQIDLPSTVVGMSTMVLVVILTRTRLGPLGMVVAVLVGSGLAAVFGARGSPVVLVGDLVDVNAHCPCPCCLISRRSRASSCPRCHWASSVWCKVPGLRRRSRTGIHPTRHRTSWGRASGTWSQACSRGCPWAGPHPRPRWRSPRVPAPASPRSWRRS